MSRAGPSVKAIAAAPADVIWKLTRSPGARPAREGGPEDLAPRAEEAVRQFASREQQLLGERPVRRRGSPRAVGTRCPGECFGSLSTITPASRRSPNGRPNPSARYRRCFHLRGTE